MTKACSNNRAVSRECFGWPSAASVLNHLTLSEAIGSRAHVWNAGCGVRQRMRAVVRSIPEVGCVCACALMCVLWYLRVTSDFTKSVYLAPTLVKPACYATDRSVNVGNWQYGTREKTYSLDPQNLVSKVLHGYEDELVSSVICGCVSSVPLSFDLTLVTFCVLTTPSIIYKPDGPSV